MTSERSRATHHSSRSRRERSGGGSPPVARSSRRRPAMRDSATSPPTASGGRGRRCSPGTTASTRCSSVSRGPGRLRDHPRSLPRLAFAGGTTSRSGVHRLVIGGARRESASGMWWIGPRTRQRGPQRDRRGLPQSRRGRPHDVLPRVVGGDSPSCPPATFTRHLAPPL